MVKVITIIDYFILLILIGSIIFWILSSLSIKNLIVLMGLIIFFCYWMIRIVFNKDMEEKICN